MIEITKTAVTGFDVAIRGMRNSWESGEKSDSGFQVTADTGYNFVIGERDLKLMSGLVKAGDSHAKFARFIDVTCDILAPLYWWKQADQYKHIVTCSTSTMHTLTRSMLTGDNFADNGYSWKVLDEMCDVINSMIKRYNAIEDEESNDKKALFQSIVQLLPSGYLQLRTVKMNYQIVRNMCKQRSGHRLDEWAEFIKWAEKLPYARELILV